MTVRRRLIAAGLIAGGLITVAPGVASAHTASFVGKTGCVEGGGWTATATLIVDNSHPASGTVTSTYHAGSPFSWTAVDTSPHTFGTGTIPTSITSVTFTVTGSVAGR